MARGKSEDEFGIIDFETDPFLSGRIPHPFAAGIYFSPQDFSLLWETDSNGDFITRIVRAISRLPECTLYAHNGGRFDFHYLLEYADGKHIQIRNGRVTQMRIGNATLKDSFLLMPFALKEFRKTKIDYAIFERNRRDKPRNRKRIESYLYDDCHDLHELLSGFRATIGHKDTIGSAAFFQMRNLGIEIPHMNETHDAMFRPFYFGGRVQAFQKGVFNGPLDYYDLNSAYPAAMRENHPCGIDYRHGRALPDGNKLGPCFVRLIARSKGALPRRAETGGGLDFPNTDREEFNATGWEIAAGLKTRTLEIIKVLDVWRPKNFINFREYVDTFYALRQKAKISGDAIKRLAYKYLLNAGYGKFAQNPRDFREYRLARYGKNVSGYEWETDFGDISLWSKSSYNGYGFFDVAIGASITGYVRAMLWRAVCASRGVLYIDTDAMLCRSANVPMGDKLGQWKLEGTVKRAAIAGKKLYGVEWSTNKNGPKHKIASKGARLSWTELLSVCKGNEVLWENDAPTFSISGAHFVKRRIRAT